MREQSVQGDRFCWQELSPRRIGQERSEGGTPGIKQMKETGRPHEKRWSKEELQRVAIHRELREVHVRHENKV